MNRMQAVHDLDLALTAGVGGDFAQEHASDAQQFSDLGECEAVVDDAGTAVRNNEALAS
ncbi:hypothetical protein [Salinibacterium sp. SWN167]|uniref:hypothetical protein n=1 Tax=Salinibacterium sp. SWN167 TaxID=2792054 RepID=UPI001E307FEB|nr:hypothetical protein [Salinibacterium sp. SWN167]